jgi:hypothetical protein
MDGKRFWEGLSHTLAMKYDFFRIYKVIVAGDGALWLKEGANRTAKLISLSHMTELNIDKKGYAKSPLPYQKRGMQGKRYIMKVRIVVRGSKQGCWPRIVHTHIALGPSVKSTSLSRSLRSSQCQLSKVLTY